MRTSGAFRYFRPNLELDQRVTDRRPADGHRAALDVGAPLLVPRSGVGATTWHELHHVSASFWPAAMSPISWAATCCAQVASRIVPSQPAIRPARHVARLRLVIGPLAAKASFTAPTRGALISINVPRGRPL